MFKKIGFLALLMLCFTINVDAQKNSKDAQRKAKQKEMERQRKEAERAKKGKKTKEEKETKEITEDDLSPGEPKANREWMERIVVGGGLGGGYSNGWNINVTPWVGYKITDRLWTGIGLDYYFSSFNYQNIDRKDKYSVIGPKVWALFYITPGFNLTTEFARNTFNVNVTQNNTKFKESGSTNSWLVGGGYTQRMGRAGVRIELLYDVLYDESNEFNFRSSALIPRLNFVYGF